MSADHRAVLETKTGARVLVLASPGNDRALLAELEGQGFSVRGVREPSDAPEVARAFRPDILVCYGEPSVLDAMDVRELLQQVRAECGGLSALVVDEHRSEAIAYAMSLRVDSVLGRHSLIDDLSRAIAIGPRTPIAANSAEVVSTGPLVGTSSEMARVWRLVTRAAPLATTVLIRGETGVGKEVVARVLHQLSPRRHAPFVAVNCAALPDTLLESEFFGHEKGAFTGAAARHVGRFEMAHGGTLLLDEIGELPPLLQAKLLRVLQERTFERVGGTKPVSVDVRIIAATNRDLESEVARGTFRADLFYRLNGLVVPVPPLRERKPDILPMWDYFLSEALRASGELGLATTDLEARRSLLSYPWPGNVRELQNVAQRAAAVMRDGVITPASLPADIASGESHAEAANELRLSGYTLREIERAAILGTLETTGDAKEAAALLGISIRKLYYRLKEYKRADEAARRVEDDKEGLARGKQSRGPAPLRIVLAEDDDAVRISLAEVLRSEGHDVIEVASGTEVLQHIKPASTEDAPSDVLITDIRMPGLNGMRLVEGLRAMGLDIPIFVITAFCDDEIRRQTARLGASLLDKPIDVEALVATLRRASAGDKVAAS